LGLTTEDDIIVLSSLRTAWLGPQGGLALTSRMLRMLEWLLIHMGPQRDITVETANGRLTFDSSDWLIGKYLFVRRSYESDTIKDAMDLLRRENFLSDNTRNTVIDVGANLGMITISLLRAGYFERAAAFEPAPNSFRLLEHNVRQNGLHDRVHTYRYALSSAEGKLELELSKDNSGDHRIRHARSPGFFREEKRRTLEVPATTLDRVFESHSELHREEVGLVWLDIQGHEGWFLDGARHILADRIPVVSELWPYAILRSGMSREQFCQILSDLFTHFCRLPSEGRQEQSISDVRDVFDAFKGPREMCQIVLVNRKA
jgi:FkbM family methyltransferase